MHARSQAAAIVLALGWALAPAPAAAGTVTVTASRDATLIESGTGPLANGAGPFLFAGRTGQAEASRRRTLLAFDLAGAVPRGAVVTSAHLVLAMSQSNAGPVAVALHRVLSPWGEGASYAEGGSGAPALPGDVTWQHASYDDLHWGSPGGDFAAVSSAGQTVDDIGAYTWTSPDLAADVQRWLDDPATNHGWILIGEETAATSVKRFGSRESADPALQPVLEIEFGRRIGDCADADFTPDALALCAAYCEVLGCEGAAPRGTARACERLAERLESAAGVSPPCTIADRDGDGIADEADNCVAATNSDQADADGDAVGDTCDNCPSEPNPGQEDGFGASGVGDACDCPCFTSVAVGALVLTLQDTSTYRDLLCIDTRAGKPLTAVTARRVDGAPCSLASDDCSALAVEFTEDRACQWNPPAPGQPTSESGISDPQREACRKAVLAASEPLGLPCN